MGNESSLFDNFMSKIRQLDNHVARWMMRHFYFLFFQIVLAGIFFIFIYNTFKALDLADSSTSQTTVEKLLAQQNINTLIVILLLLLNSFWMLYMFNGMERLRLILKDISFSLMRRKN